MEIKNFKQKKHTSSSPSDVNWSEELLMLLTQEELETVFKGKMLKSREYVSTMGFEDVDENHFASDTLDIDGPDIEYVVFNLKDIKVVEVLVLKYLGYEPKEIADTLGYDNVGSYYQLNFKLKRDFESVQEKTHKDQ